MQGQYTKFYPYTSTSTSKYVEEKNDNKYSKHGPCLRLIKKKYEDKQIHIYQVKA